MTLLRQGETAARAGEEAKARRIFRAVLTRDPANLAALLWMAWLSEDPRTGLRFAERALEADPNSKRALEAQRWAQSQITTSAEQGTTPQDRMLSGDFPNWRRLAPLVAIGSLLAFALGAMLIILWFSNDLHPAMAGFVVPSSPTPSATLSRPPTDTATLLPSHTRTAEPTAIPTETPSPTSRRTPTPTSTATPFPTPTVTSSTTPLPSPTPTAPSTDTPPSPTPEAASPTETPTRDSVRWVDVDLSAQTLTAYEGEIPVRSTLVSTGLPNTPTPVGEYRIYIKLRYDDMSGPGYYLRDVPYTMYFYRGYGIHGTYWHSNFGHPMSHGCINLPTSQAEWLFHWASVGTLVKIHW